MTTLIIARHGNTFGPDDTPTRVGLHTDLPLVESGREQARKIGAWLRDNRMIPDVVYASHLERTQETAKIAIRESGVTNPVYALDIFNEIDYGPDENKPEEDVIARLGQQALKDWDEKAAVPEGWIVDPDQIIQNWHSFAENLLPASSRRTPGSFEQMEEDSGLHGHDEVTLVVTSNGIARFAPYITGDFEGFHRDHKIKLSTGALGVFKHENGQWVVKEWNFRP